MVVVGHAPRREVEGEIRIVLEHVLALLLVGAHGIVLRPRAVGGHLGVGEVIGKTGAAVQHRHGHIGLAFARQRGESGRQPIVHDIQVLIELVQLVNRHRERVILGVLHGLGPAFHAEHLGPSRIDVLLGAIGTVELEVAAEHRIIAAELFAQAVDDTRHADERILRFAHMHDLLAHESLVELGGRLGGVLEFQPLLHGQEQVGVLNGSGSHVGLLVHAEVDVGVSLVPLLAVAHDAVLVAGLLPAHRDLVGLSGQQRLAHRRQGVQLPLVHGLVLQRPQASQLVVHKSLLLGLAIDTLRIPALHSCLGTAKVLALGQAHRPTDAEGLLIGTVAPEVGGTRGVARFGLLLGEHHARLVHLAAQHVQGHSTEDEVRGQLAHIGELTSADTRERGGVQLDRTLDSVGIDPGELSGFLQGEVLAGLPLDLAGALAQTPVHLGFTEYHRIDRRVLRGGVGEGLHAVGASIEAHVGRRIVHVVGVGRGVHVVGPHLFRLQRQARVRIHEEGVVGPVLAELLVVELVRDNVVEPAQKHGDVTHGTNGQPDVGLGRLFGIVGVDDNGLYAALSHFGVGASGIGCAGSARLGAPQHHALHGRLPGVPHLAGVVALVAVVGATAHPLARAVGGQIALAATAGNAHRSANGILGDALEHVTVGAATASAHHDGIGAVLPRSQGHLLAHDIVGLIPRHDFPVVAAAGSYAPHGMQYMARAVHQMLLVEGLGAQAALGQGTVVVALDLHHHAVFGVHPQRTAVVAAMAAAVMALAQRGRAGKLLVSLHERGVRGPVDALHLLRHVGELSVARLPCRHYLLLSFEVAKLAPAGVVLQASSHTKPPAFSRCATNALGYRGSPDFPLSEGRESCLPSSASISAKVLGSLAARRMAR